MRKSVRKSIRKSLTKEKPISKLLQLSENEDNYSNDVQNFTNEKFSKPEADQILENDEKRRSTKKLERRSSRKSKMKRNSEFRYESGLGLLLYFFLQKYYKCL